jgi:alpha-mannosidase
VAEIGWLQRYLVDQGGTLPSAPHLTQTLCLMGGAITSPDNIVCDGETYVRAYLVGRQWAQSVGLGAAVANVSWMPDDFGHDPELPVILSAMGLTAVGFARVPGAFPLFATPLDKSSSLACLLMTQGVAFAHFMPNTYGVPFYSQGADGSINAIEWTQFIKSDFLSSYPCSNLSEVVWPGDVAFAPAGGDFALPDSGWVNGVARFNQPPNVTTATIGSFPDYVSAASGASLATIQIDPSNFYTGHFGSRPELKILQARASRNLVAAEAVSSLLWLGAQTSSAALDALDGAIGQVWSILAPSSHHDFVTGTSPDSVYKTEQLPMLSLAARLATGIYRQAIQIIADSIEPSGAGSLVAVHNPVGVARSGVFKIERGTAVSFGNSGAAKVQPLADGGLLVQAPSVQSLGYESGMVTFGQCAPPPDPVVADDEVTIDNGALSITLSKSQLWAITSITPNGGANVLLNGAAANLLQSYHDNGNIYQYGNEPDAGGTFTARTNAFKAGKAAQTEFGPLRWRVEAEVTGPDKINYLIAYTLIAGESLIRMSVTGSAHPITTVVATFPAIATDGVTKGTHLTYGTAHHFHEDAAPAYWDGPMFKATHNFLMPSSLSRRSITVECLHGLAIRVRCWVRCSATRPALNAPPSAQTAMRTRNGTRCASRRLRSTPRRASRWSSRYRSPTRCARRSLHLQTSPNLP